MLLFSGSELLRSGRAWRCFCKHCAYSGRGEVGCGDNTRTDPRMSDNQHLSITRLRPPLGRQLFASRGGGRDNTADVSRALSRGMKMFCWGVDVSTQMPLLESGAPRTFSEPSEIQCLRDKPVTEVSCGAGHTVFLLTDGTVYTCGQNDSGQLGRKASTTALEQVMALSTRTIIHVACGKNHSLALCDSGSVFAWGDETYGQLGSEKCTSYVSHPSKVKQLEVPIMQIRCGHYHSLALSQAGTVYSWGQNTCGQLGNGQCSRRDSNPQRVRFLNGIPITLIAAGESHSFALSLSGAVYGWGSNNYGQLGLKNIIDQAKPCFMDQLKMLDVCYISCGNNHSVLLTKAGNVFGCGDGRSGQLGLVRKPNVTSFQRVKKIQGKVSQIACGSDHTLVYIPSSDLVLSFGFGIWDKTEKDSTGRQELVYNNVHKIFAGESINFLQTQPPIPAVDLCWRASTKQLLTLDEDIVDRWINLDEISEERIKAEKDIDRIFSSSSSLIGSFLKRSEGNQCKARKKYFRIDMEAARRIFQKLTAKDWVVNKIASSLKTKLIPNLGLLCSDEEALMIYLILPESSVMQDNKNTDAITDFVKAIARLDAASKNTLGKYWTTLGSPYLITLVMVIKLLLTNLIIELHSRSLQINQSPDYFDKQKILFKEVLEVLQLVYNANINSEHGISPSCFQLNELCLFQKYFPLRHEDEVPNDIALMFLSYPFTLDLTSKIHVFYLDLHLRMQKTVLEVLHLTLQNSLTGSSVPPKCSYFVLNVNRENLISDTFTVLKNVGKAELQKKIKVVFQGEPGIDTGAIKTEFFKCLFDQLILPDSNMFVYFKDFRIVWFPSQVSVLKDYFLLGMLCGLVLYNKCVVYIPFPLVLFKMLLGIKPSLEDLLELDDDLHRNLKDILENDKVEDVGLNCTMPWQGHLVDIFPNGENRPLTNKNRKKFVKDFLNYIFKTSIKKTYDEFRNGFYHILDENVIKLFNPQELKKMLVGSDDYDWKILEENTVYKGRYHRSHPTIKMFWDVFHQLSLDEKKQFLVMGMKSMQINISSCTLTEDDLPMATTCFKILHLPEYTSPASLKTKLVRAITAKKSFQMA
ncbi:probable E3 ubiquitin-protein ligase HERC6 isoform X2 [Narcine bancroftii]|uniref:probable E3 ubiquitin-protein ligase HERC6 isoform X2 n=1 Tax=Narcine bancroftii TaxID=1343680 RepID=UPI003831A786